MIPPFPRNARESFVMLPPDKGKRKSSGANILPKNDHQNWKTEKKKRHLFIVDSFLQLCYHVSPGHLSSIHLHPFFMAVCADCNCYGHTHKLVALFVLWRVVSAQIHHYEEEMKKRKTIVKKEKDAWRVTIRVEERFFHLSWKRPCKYTREVWMKDIRRRKKCSCVHHLWRSWRRKEVVKCRLFLGYVFLNAVNKGWKPLMTRSTTMMMIEKWEQK